MRPALRLDDTTGCIAWLTGRWTAPAPGRVVESSYRFLESNRIAFDVTSPRDEFALLKVTKDDQLPGWRDVFFEQRVNGLPVLNSRLAFHYDGDGRLVAVTGDYLPSPHVSATPTLTARQAADAALAATATARDALAMPPIARLAYYAFPTGGLCLAYEVELVGSDPSLDWTLVIDAATGGVLERDTGVRALGRGIDLFGRRVSLRTSRIGRYWKLVDKSEFMRANHTSNHPYTRNEGCIEVRDCLHGGSPTGREPIVKDPNGDNFFNHGGTDPKKNQRAAVSLAKNLETIYKALRTRVGRNSLDDQGISMVGNVHLGYRYQNAFWNGAAQMVYFGDNASRRPPYSKSLDAVAHECGHGISAYILGIENDGFTYQFPSGALDESYADIWGCTVDYRDWQMGEDLGSVMRDLEDPGSVKGAPLPGKMWDYDLMVVNLDGGGNHTNCGIGGHFYQQLAVSLPATPPALDGRFTAIKILYRAYAYLTPTSGMRDWSFALEQAAIDLYGAGSAERAATHDVLVDLGLRTLDFGPNDNGDCMNGEGKLMQMYWSPGDGICYVAEKFTAPAGAKLARVYLALNYEDERAYLGWGDVLRVFVVPADADGSPDVESDILDYEEVTEEAIEGAGHFTPVTMTANDAETPRNVELPASGEFFVLAGFYPDDSSYDSMVILQDNGVPAAPSTQNWVLSAGYDEGTASYYLIEQTASEWLGIPNPRNFMIRPMYYFEPEGITGTSGASSSGATSRTDGAATVEAGAKKAETTPAGPVAP